jgi:hypothetical protein
MCSTWVIGYSNSCKAAPSFQLKFSSRRKWTDLLRGGDEVIPHVFNLVDSKPTPFCDFLW